MSFRGTRTWRPAINENIWNSLLLWEQLLCPRKLVHININNSPNTKTVQTAKNHKQRPFFQTRELCHGAILMSRIRGWLHGEFQLGLKFWTAHRAEIVLRLHGEFQPECNGKICRKTFYMLSCAQLKRCACPSSYFSPGWNLNTITWSFSARAEIWIRLHEVFQPVTGLKFPAWNSLHIIAKVFLKHLFRKPSWSLSPANRAEISARSEIGHVIGPLVGGNFENSRCCILNTKNDTELETCENIYLLSGCQ